MDLLRPKRGEIELSTIITFIIVAVVLIIVVAFFLGGTTNITRTIKNTFFGVTAGTDKSLAIENCRNYCAQAQSFPDVITKQNSPYCTYYVKIDDNNDGEPDFKQVGGDKVYDRWFCHMENRKKDMDNGNAKIQGLNVPCDLGKEGTNSITCDSTSAPPALTA